uniref:RNA-directed DNA polymerase, eukaryota, reverse transcriptase zinc-binding domain protein n=1 Tax=Tanacetum cinerariifolium TaxID=118510 RepID=A0A6L2NE92_TANCI|nr:RNA-directed DNA polymerase, eukaryota, reverse transcriptase zinc-binding domain protein [Tanacetum cinerariifolium]
MSDLKTSKISLQSKFDQTSKISKSMFISNFSDDCTSRDLWKVLNFGIQYGDRKIAWVKWSKVLASKKYGGLGVSSFYALNRALLFKWVWRYLSYDNSLRSWVISVIHGLNGQVLSAAFNSTWSFSINKVNPLKDKGVDLISHCFPPFSVVFIINNGWSLEDNDVTSSPSSRTTSKHLCSSVESSSYSNLCLLALSCSTSSPALLELPSVTSAWIFFDPFTPSKSIATKVFTLL